MMNDHIPPLIWSFDGGDSVAGRNTVVCGTSGAGKTTLMVSLVAMLGRAEKMKPDEVPDKEGVE